MNAKRKEEIDVLKGWAILFVIIGHGITFFGNDMPYLGQVFCNIIYSFHMPIFFIVGGYVVGHKDFKSLKLSAYIKDNFCLLYLPYVVLMVFWFLEKACGQYILKSNGTQFEFTFLNMAKKFFDGSAGTTWFLLSMLLVRISYSIIMHYGNLAAATMFYSVLWGLSQFIAPDNRIIMYLAWGVFYCIGAWSYQIIRSNRKRIKLFYVLPFVLLLCFVAVLYAGPGFAHVDSVTRLLMGTGVTGLLVVLRTERWGIIGKFFKFWGFYSMDTYMIHSIIGMFISRMLLLLLGGANYFLHVLLYTIIQLVLVRLSISIYVNNPYFKWIRKIIAPNRKERTQ